MQHAWLLHAHLSVLRYLQTDQPRPVAACRALIFIYGMLIIIIVRTQLICDHFFGQATTNVACIAWPFPPGVLSLSNAQIELPHWGPLVDYQSGPLAKLVQTLQIACLPKPCRYAYRLTTDKAEFTTDISQHSKHLVGSRVVYVPLGSTVHGGWGHGWCSGCYEYRYFFSKHTGT
jgi:hypothetical protein